MMTQYSYSRIGCFKTCPYMYKLRYVDKLKTLPDTEPTNALYLGTAMHTGIEKNVEEAIRQYLSNYPVIDDLQINETIKMEHIIPKAKAVLPDGEYELQIDDEEFIGFADLLVPKGDNHYDLYDFKYSNNVENYLKSGQLHVYKYYIEKTTGKVIDNMYFVFLPKIMIRQKKTEDLYQFRKRLCEELSKSEIKIVKVDYDFNKVLEYLADVERVKTATEFPKNESRLCDWCEFKDYCQRKETTMITLPENKRRDLSQRKKRKIWIYGQSFTGKTTLANQFPDPLMLNTDGNIANVDAPYLLINDIVKTEGRMTTRVMGWEVFLNILETLEQKQNDFKTIVVDLLEDVFELCRAYTFKELGIEHESDAGFGKGYDIVRKRYLDAMKRLTNMDYENIVLLSKEDVSKSITKKGGENITTIRPDIQDKVASKLAGMVDVVARAYVDNDKYYLSFKSNEFVFGGGRLGVKGKEIASEYKEVMKVYDEANKNGEVKTEKPTEQPRRVVVNK